MDVEEKFDCVLNYYKKNRMHNDNEWQPLGDEVGVELNEVVIMLTDEGFIALRDGRPSHQVTIKGMLFEGFVKRKQITAAESQRILRLESYTFYASVLAAIGTCGILIFEIVKFAKQYYYPLFPCWTC